MIDNLKGHVINSDVATCFQQQVPFKVIMNIKIFGLRDLVNFDSASGDEKIDISAPQTGLYSHMCKNFIWKFYK